MTRLCFIFSIQNTLDFFLLSVASARSDFFFFNFRPSLLRLERLVVRINDDGPTVVLLLLMLLLLLVLVPTLAIELHNFRAFIGFFNGLCAIDGVALVGGTIFRVIFLSFFGNDNPADVDDADDGRACENA